jgi:hypothetical protein
VTGPFFSATSIVISRCERRDCSKVHIQLLDEDGFARAQAVIACETVDGIVAELQIVRSRILGNYTSLGLH